MNILMTGIHGFVGSNLTEALRASHTIYGVDIISPDKDGVVKTFTWSDLDNNAIHDVDAIIHLAGKAHDTKNQSEAKTYFDINTGLTKKIYDYFLTSTAKKFIFFSSIKAAADTVHGDILTEDIVPSPKGPYGESKILAEKYIQDHWPAVDSGKFVYILRPCMIHGPGNKGNLNLLYSVVRKGIPWPLGTFENRRTFTSIGNLCFAIDGFLSNEIESGIYHMADDESLSTNELISVMCEAMGRKVKIWYLPKGFINVAAKIGGVLHFPLNPERLRKLTENYVASNAKIKKALGVEHMPVTAREGLRRTILSFQKLFFIALAFSCLHVYGQSLPVGTPVLEDVYRRDQLVGSFDESVSFTLRPLYPSLIDEKQTLDSSTIKGVKVFYKLLPLTWKQQYNSDHPEGLNDGAMIPARGYQTMLSGGFFAKYRWLSVQFMPEFVYAENRAYQGFPDELLDTLWNVYYDQILNRIDIPERFGKASYYKAFWGQSSIRLTFDPISIGISNENLWWGPGMQNALLMTNNAPGFMHLTLNTVRPIHTTIGSFEGQLVGGRLDASGYPGIDSTRLAQHGVTYAAKPKDWRYLSGFILTYQPRWLPGLFFGAAGSNIFYHQDPDKKDGLASVFMRWLAPESHMEAYLEYGREERSTDLKDLILEPNYTRASILGFRKLTPIKKSQDEFIDVQAEVTYFVNNVITANRAPGAAMWYVHDIVRDGYTQNGQYLGAGIGTSSNMQSMNISWVKKMKRIGLEFKRVQHDESFWYYINNDLRKHWVDVGGAIIGEWDYKQFLFNTKIQLVGSHNYQHYYDPVPAPGAQPYYWDHGAVRYNVHAELGVTYLFN